MSLNLAVLRFSSRPMYTSTDLQIQAFTSWPDIPDDAAPAQGPEDDAPPAERVWGAGLAGGNRGTTVP